MALYLKKQTRTKCVRQYQRMRTHIHNSEINRYQYFLLLAGKIKRS